MSTEERTENDAVIEAAIAQVAGEELVDGAVYAFKLPSRVEVIDLDTAEYEVRRERPRRKTGTVTVRNVASFAQYHRKHADDATEIYVDLDQATITAVLNAHQRGGDQPRWGDHRLVLQLTQTLPWRKWVPKHGHLLPQVQFADFLEENLADIAEEPVPAAVMLQVAASFQARTNGHYKATYNPSSGDRSLVYEEETTASTGGGKSDVKVPDKFAVVLAPFDDIEPYLMQARLRFRIEGGHLKLGFLLDRPEAAYEDAIKQVVTKVEQALNPGWDPEKAPTPPGPRVMRGTPIGISA